jgi:hypothetical protein
MREIASYQVSWEVKWCLRLRKSSLRPSFWTRCCAYVKVDCFRMCRHLQVFEDNSLVREALEQPGEGRVLVSVEFGEESGKRRPQLLSWSMTGSQDLSSTLCIGAAL